MGNNRKKAINPSVVAKPLKPYYSNAVRSEAGPLLWISGQVSIDRNGNLVGKGDLRAQAIQVLENIKGILSDSNAELADVVKVTVYVTDIRAFDELADIREKYFPIFGPASVICEVSALAWPEFEIEIEAVAAID